MIIYLLEHLHTFWPGLVICLITGLIITNCPWGQKLIAPFASTRLDRCIVGLLIGGIIMCGWTKGPVPIGNTVAQFVTSLYSGGIVDVSGLVAASTEAETVAAFAELSGAITEAASATITDAQAEIDDVAFLITNATRKVVYVQCSLPRTDPLQGVINHNISAIVVRTRQSADAATLSRFIWYSAEPIVAPKVAAVVDVGGGPIALVAITNSFPSTELVQGIPCVRYDYALPEGLRNVVFFPDTELEFGCAGVPLEIPSGGVIVSDDTGSHLGYTGTDTYFNGRVKVEYLGGIAITAWLDAAKMTNGVYEL